jgi:hypothetical protein
VAFGCFRRMASIWEPFSRPRRMQIATGATTVRRFTSLHGWASIASSWPPRANSRCIRDKVTRGAGMKRRACLKTILVGAWGATATHQQVWPTIEKTLASKDYTILARASSRKRRCRALVASNRSRCIEAFPMVFR